MVIFHGPFNRFVVTSKFPPGLGLGESTTSRTMDQAAASLDRKGPMALLQRLPDGEEVVVSWKGITKRENEKNNKSLLVGWVI